ncbi:hypothetical protein [Paragemmobacter straminiformis]|uniref:Uncharacterized protein n=1 Tax=Paragemmobacter straminiformis TaxID=2045119 RepID=A0A842IC28_9RHOB|nr:hypothetical protein [Gemmobacter straminiformis]MBC2837139.1 hypothetical protein [Gemmobacter straminiformis]
MPALHFLVGSALVFGSYGLKDLIDGLIHPKVLIDFFGAISIVYLPHGVLVLLAWFYGWLAVPIVLPATVLSVWLLRGADGLGAMMFLLVTIKTVAAPLTFDLFRLAGIDARGPGEALNWKVLFLIGLVQSVISNQARFWLGCCGELTSDELMVAFSGSVLGDMIGLLAVMLGAMFFFRALRQG